MVTVNTYETSYNVTQKILNYSAYPIALQRGNKFWFLGSLQFREDLHVDIVKAGGGGVSSLRETVSGERAAGDHSVFELLEC